MTTKFRSATDWTTWLTFIFTIAVSYGPMLFVGFDWILFIISSSLLVTVVILCLGTWYEISGNDLTVYQFFRPHKFPIDKIAIIRESRSMLSAPALSSHRLVIRFTDRKVMKGSMPLMISPARRQQFIRLLLEENPYIVH